MKKKIEITDTTLCCKVCGGTNVERLAWVDANTHEYLEQFFDTISDEDTWCRDCEANTGLMFKTEWDSQNGKE